VDDGLGVGVGLDVGLDDGVGVGVGAGGAVVCVGLVTAGVDDGVFDGLGEGLLEGAGAWEVGPEDGRLAAGSSASRVRAALTIRSAAAADNDPERSATRASAISLPSARRADA